MHYSLAFIFNCLKIHFMLLFCASTFRARSLSALKWFCHDDGSLDQHISHMFNPFHSACGFKRGSLLIGLERRRLLVGVSSESIGRGPGACATLLIQGTPTSCRYHHNPN